MSIDGVAGDATTATQVLNGPTGPELTFNPGRIDPSNPAFDNSRKPLVAKFMFNELPIFLINTHSSSRGGSDPLFGDNQPPENNRDDQRLAQAEAVRNFTRQIRYADTDARIVVLGDFNAFQFEAPLEALEDDGALQNLVETLEPADRYSFIFEGNSQALDHMLIGGPITTGPQYDILRVNAVFSDQTSDHDPGIARLKLNK